MSWLTLDDAPSPYAAAALYAVAAVLLLLLVIPKEALPMSLSTTFAKAAAAVRRTVGPVVRWVQREPALAFGVAGAFGDAFTQALGDGLAPFDAVRSAAWVAAAWLVRRKVTPTRTLPPPPPPAPPAEG